MTSIPTRTVAEPMQKKYQVFISSTYTDLIPERQEITKAILELNHIPSGMEAFLSADEEQFSYICKVIDQCDYYVLIIGGRYGSIGPRGLSYTEMEYDYAVQTRKTVLACIHGDPSQLKAAQVDTDPTQLELLHAFKEKVKRNRLVSFWTDLSTLKSNVIISLAKATSENPAIGWIRGDAAASEDIMATLLEQRSINDALKAEIEALRAEVSPKVPDLAGFDECFQVNLTYWDTSERRDVAFDLTWGEIFRAIGPEIGSNVVRDFSVPLSKFIIEKKATYLAKKRPFIFDTDVATIEVQMQALGLIAPRDLTGADLPLRFSSTGI